MSRSRILVVAGLVVAMMGAEASAQRRGGGGAVSSGVRGAAVGGLLGGSSAAQKGAKVGVAVGVARNAGERRDERAAQQSVNTEAQTRAEYQTTAEYKNGEHSDFSAAPPQLIESSKAPGTSVETKEAVILKDGKPVIAIIYPADWKKSAGSHSVVAVSKDKSAWSEIGTLNEVADRQAGIEKIKGRLAEYLKDIQYDEPTETKRGALVLTGTATGKKAGVEVVFAVGVFPTRDKQIGAVAFAVDKNIEDHYKEAIRSVCESIRTEKDLEKSAKPESKAETKSKPVTKKK